MNGLIKGINQVLMVQEAIKKCSEKSNEVSTDDVIEELQKHSDEVPIEWTI